MCEGSTPLPTALVCEARTSGWHMTSGPSGEKTMCVCLSRALPPETGNQARHERIDTTKHGNHAPHPAPDHFIHERKRCERQGIPNMKCCDTLHPRGPFEGTIALPGRVASRPRHPQTPQYSASTKSTRPEQSHHVQKQHRHTPKEIVRPYFLLCHAPACLSIVFLYAVHDVTAPIFVSARSTFQFKQT